MSAKDLSLMILLGLVTNGAVSQGRNVHWTSGLDLWIDFNSDPPLAVPGLIELSSFSHTALSDTAGNLLFYFDGQVFYTAALDTMPHGLSDSLWTPPFMGQMQSIALPRPGWPNRYYLFMIDQYRWSGYVELDMTANGGQGDVISPDIIYYMDSAAETRIAATRHANGEDYWIVLHEQGSDEFHAFRLGSAGLDPVPVISHAGTAIQIDLIGPDHYGRLKFNTQGDLLAHTSLAHYLPDSSIVELFHFDQWTGAVSLVAELPHYTSASGVEFSPDGQRLYCTHMFSPPGGFATTAIWQLSLDPLVETTIVGSALVIAVDSSSFGLDQVNSTMELAPNGKIYVKIGAPNGILAVINSPNAPGPACSYDRDGIDTQVAFGVVDGLPNQCRRYHDSAPSWATGVPAIHAQGSSTLFVRPNPAHDRISVTWPQNVEAAQVVCVDALGRTVQINPVDGNVLDVSKLSTGFYHILALDRTGMPIARVRFVKD